MLSTIQLKEATNRLTYPIRHLNLEVKLSCKVANQAAFICGCHILHSFIISFFINHFVISKAQSPFIQAEVTVVSKPEA